MKQVGIVFGFEFFEYVKRKSYIIITALLVVLIAVGLSLPQILSLFKDEADSGADNSAAKAAQVAFVSVEGKDKVDVYTELMQPEGFQFVSSNADEAALKKAVQKGDYDFAIIMTGPLSYERIVLNAELVDQFTPVFDELLLTQYRAASLEEAGLTAQQADAIMGARVEGQTVVVESGKDQAQSFFYTYILVFLLYFAIVYYGQFIASSVVSEKSTRTMELLITSTKPSSLIFGKVLGAGAAGLTQMALLLGTSYLFYGLNSSYYADNFIVQSIFAMPLDVMVYTLIFFVLGFFIYAFLFAAFASLVSRMEELSTVISPLMIVFVFAFMVVMFSMSGGGLDSPLMIFCSYFPLTSPMAMFARIAMGQVAFWKILISIGILIVSTIGFGYFSTVLYQLGVLLYGNRPKPKEIIKMLRTQRNRKRS